MKLADRFAAPISSRIFLQHERHADLLHHVLIPVPSGYSVQVEPGPYEYSLDQTGQASTGRHVSTD